MSDRKTVHVIGAGPAGLTAAYGPRPAGDAASVYEADTIVGGIARTVEYKGFRFDIGGHRFFTQGSRGSATSGTTCSAPSSSRARGCRASITTGGSSTTR